MTARGAFVLISLIVATSLAASPAHAAGIGVAPEAISFTLTRDGSARATLLVFDSDENQDGAELTLAGDVADWLTLADDEQPTVAFAFDQTGRVIVPVTAVVPSDAANGRYIAAIEVRPTGTTDSVRASVVVPVVIEVTGDAVVSGEATITIPERAASSEAIPIAVAVENTGTVRVVPVVTYSVVDQAGGISTGVVRSDALAPGERVNVPVAASHGQPAGAEVDVDVAVSIDELPIAGSTGTVGIVEAAELTATLVPLDATVARTAGPGGIATITASVSNGGAADVATAFRGAVEVDGNIVDTVASIPLVVAPQATATVDLFVPVAEEGTYRVTGRWDGQEPESGDVVIEWRVGSAVSSWALLALGTVVVAGVVVLTFSLRHATTRPSTEGQARSLEDASR